MRPQRQAARDALSKIRSIQEWENLSENSARFKELASRIDDELAKEIEHKHVDPRDVDMSEAASSQDDDDECEHDSFVVSSDDEAYEQEDKDFALLPEELHESDSMDEEDTQDSADEEEDMLAEDMLAEDMLAEDMLQEDMQSTDAEDSCVEALSDAGALSQASVCTEPGAQAAAGERQEDVRDGILELADDSASNAAAADFCNTVLLGT